MKLFSYPTLRHSRILSPGPFADYRTFKPFLRKEFQARCVYCRMLDTLSPRTNTFGADHYLPQRYHPELATTYSNLFYSCPDCNSAKRAWPYDQKGVRVGFIVPNPCDHAMAKHLEFRADGSIEGKTRDGKATIDLLYLNDPQRVQFRAAHSLAKRTFEAKLRELRNKKRLVKDRLRTGQPLPANAMAVLARIERQRRELILAVMRLYSPAIEN